MWALVGAALLILLLVPRSVRAEETPHGSTTPSTTPSTTRTAPQGITPRGALFRSTVIPGWGQLATGHPIKATLFAGGAAALGARIVLKTRDANEATDKAQEAETEEEFARYSAERQDAINARDNAVTWLVVLWAYNMVDAYVEGHFVGLDGVELRILGAGPEPPARFPIASLQVHW